MSSPSPRRSIESVDSLQFSPPQRHQQFPFPQHDWTRRSSSTTRSHMRRSSTASSLHSVGGVLDTSSQSRLGAVREAGQNAISTLLQPPIVRTGMLPHTAASVASGHRPPSTKDIPPVTLTNIPHVESSAFSEYLSQVGSLYDAFQRAKADGDGGSAQLFRRESGKKDEFVDMLERGLRKEQTSSPATPHALSPADIPQPRRRTSGGASKRSLPAVTPLSTIPTVYFEENFHLENPRTFDIVSERSEVVRQPQSKSAEDMKGANGTLEAPQPFGRKALATNAILQEKLSWYMDTVEVHLISSISSASTSFFAALGSLRDLQSEAADSVTRIKSLREDLSNLDRQMAVGGLKVIEMKRRRENLRRLTDATDQLQSVINGLSTCDETIDKGELETAVQRLDAVERLICGELDTGDAASISWFQPRLPPTIIDLQPLKALEGVSEGIQQLRYRIGKGFEARFLETLLTDLRQHVQNVPPQETLKRWVLASQRSRGEQGRAQSGLPAYLRTTDSFRSDLRTNLMGLSSANHTAAAASAFRDGIVREMKVLIRRHLPSSTDDDAESVASASTRSSRTPSQQDKNSILKRNLRALDPEDAEEFFVSIYADIGEALRRLSIQVKVLLDVTSGVSPPPSSGGLRSPPRSPNFVSLDGYLGSGKPANYSLLQDELMEALDMSSLLGQAVDAAQTQVTKLLTVRTDVTVLLPLERFLRYFNLNKMFADECEAISGRSGAALKGIVNNHITAFVSRFGDVEKQQLAQSMEADRWEPKDFDEEDNAILSRILQGMTGNPAEWLKRGSLLEDSDSGTTNGTSTAETNGIAKEKPKAPTRAIIDEEKYIISDSAVYALRGIDRFESLLVTIPSMTTEVSSSICDYLKAFNSRLCQLILGAGAMQTAGLKNINTKHLAIASQTLSFMIAILPYIRECARRHTTGPRASLGEFDNVKRLLQDQQVSIHDKLIDIMSNRATVHVRNLKKVEWDNDTERDVSPNMETLTKETVTLHKVISKYLSEMSIQMIMVPVFGSYREQLGTVFREAPVKTSAGQARLIRDARLFDAKLGQINGAGDIGAHLIKLAEEKKPSQPAAEPSEGRRSAETSASTANAADAADGKDNT